jgi:hypothetical protein
MLYYRTAGGNSILVTNLRQLLKTVSHIINFLNRFKYNTLDSKIEYALSQYRPFRILIQGGINECYLGRI